MSFETHFKLCISLLYNKIIQIFINFITIQPNSLKYLIGLILSFPGAFLELVYWVCMAKVLVAGGATRVALESRTKGPTETEID